MAKTVSLLWDRRRRFHSRHTGKKKNSNVYSALL